LWIIATWFDSNIKYLTKFVKYYSLDNPVDFITSLHYRKRWLFHGKNSEEKERTENTGKEGEKARGSLYLQHHNHSVFFRSEIISFPDPYDLEREAFIEALSNEVRNPYLKI
jgi:hypothetical protein